MIAAELVRHLLVYDPETGVLRWKNNKAGTPYMARAGSIDTDNYGYKRRRIRINGKMYRSADLVWLYMTGEWPTSSVDHKDRDGTNDAWDNLRLATRSQQMANRRGWSPEFPKGVSRSRNRYIARVQVDKKSIYLGSFDTTAEAKLAYDRAAILYHGEFARGVN